MDITEILTNFNAGETTIVWVTFAVAAIRALAATAAANIPNEYMGETLRKIIDLLGGNSGYASGSQ